MSPAQAEQLPAPTTTQELTKLVLERLDVLFFEGTHHGDGEKLVAALEHLIPSTSEDQLWQHRTRNALRGWGKREPGTSHAPPPKNLIMAIPDRGFSSSSNTSLEREQA